MQPLEADWQDQIGKRRFAEVESTLKELLGVSEEPRASFAPLCNLACSHGSAIGAR